MKTVKTVKFLTLAALMGIASQVTAQSASTLVKPTTKLQQPVTSLIGTEGTGSTTSATSDAIGQTIEKIKTAMMTDVVTASTRTTLDAQTKNAVQTAIKDQITTTWNSINQIYHDFVAATVKTVMQKVTTLNDAVSLSAKAQAAKDLYSTLSAPPYYTTDTTALSTLDTALNTKMDDLQTAIENTLTNNIQDTTLRASVSSAIRDQVDKDKTINSLYNSLAQKIQNTIETQVSSAIGSSIQTIKNAVESLANVPSVATN